MEKLPAEVIVEILNKLESSDYYSASLFCNQWNNAVEVSFRSLVLKLCNTVDFKTAARRIAESYSEYNIYCLECPNMSCRSLGLPDKCPKCNGKIRRDKTTIVIK
jgi:hypothetical protein